MDKQQGRLAAIAGVAALGLVFAASAAAQGKSGGVVGGAVGAAGNAGVGIDRGMPARPDLRAPERMPGDKAAGKVGKEARGKRSADVEASTSVRADTAATAGAGNSSAEVGANAEASADAKGSVSSGDAAADRAAKGNPQDKGERGRSASAPGHTGVTGLERATLRADEHAQGALEAAAERQAEREDDKAEPEPQERGRGRSDRR